MDRLRYDQYLAAFNRRDYDAVLAHYADRFEIVFAGYRFTTRDSVKHFYGFLHAHVSEQISVQHYVADDRLVAMEAVVRLEGLRDLTPEALAAEGLDRIHPIARGQVVEIPQFIHYHLHERKITRALCAVFEPPRD